MKLAITLAKEAAKLAPLVLRGDYSKAIHQAAQIGYDAVELHVPDPIEVDVREIRGACEASGVLVSSIGTGLAYVRDAITLTSRDQAIRHRARARLQAFVRLGSELGSIVIIGLIKGQVRDCADRAAYYRHLTEAFDDCLPLARQWGVTMVLEAMNRYESDALNSIEECVRFIEQFDPGHLKLHVDTFHMNIEEDHIGANIIAAGGHIGHVHVADNNRGFPGSGHYDFKETIAALRAVGYCGTLSVECLGLPSPEIAAKGAYQFLHRASASYDPM